MSLKFMKQDQADISSEEMDPLAGMANLFDASIVLIVSMMLALFMSFDLVDLLNPDTEVTITRRSADGEVEMVTREGNEIKVQRVTSTELSGVGTRLGMAFQLEDGRVVYVPEQ